MTGENIMKRYRRILVPIFSAGHAEDLLPAIRDLASGHSSQVLVVRLVDDRVVFDGDGPAGRLPGELAARRATDARRRLDMQLARHDLGWVEAITVRGRPEDALAQQIARWHPDLVLTRRGQPPRELPDGVDLLHVAGRSFLRNFADALLMPQHHLQPTHGR